VVSFTPRPLYFQGKSPWYALGRRLDGSQEEKNSQPPLRIEHSTLTILVKEEV
jgi:hypothetical protein